jgi:phosphopantothenoylcysteine decarboxylase/phosphopantothenate--cysteine ligase
MRQAVLAESRSAEVYIAAAAVADYRPRTRAADKIKKSEDSLALDLERTPDILAELGARAERPLLVGFAAETRDVAQYARDKLVRKNLDLIAANQVGEGMGFEVSDNALVLYAADGEVIDLGHADKSVLAGRLLDVVGERLANRSDTA